MGRPVPGDPMWTVGAATVPTLVASGTPRAWGSGDGRGPLLSQSPVRALGSEEDRAWEWMWPGVK